MLVDKAILCYKNLDFPLFVTTNAKIKKILKEFEFYNFKIYINEKTTSAVLNIEYPANPYWYKDFEKIVNKEIKILGYATEWTHILDIIKYKIKAHIDMYNMEMNILDTNKNSEVNILQLMFKYNLRDYQAFDTMMLTQKIKFNKKYEDFASGLLLSEQRTGKTRVAIATTLELLENDFKESTLIVICPKSAQAGWITEFSKLVSYTKQPIFQGGVITKLSDVKDFSNEFDENRINLRIITYDLFKKLTQTQIAQLVDKNKSKKVIIIGDEIHRLRNFNTIQSESIFKLKTLLQRWKINPIMIGMTGTPAVKNSTDIFGLFCFINDSKVHFQPYYYCFNEFKEYFYNCTDTMYGKKCLSLKRKQELMYLRDYYSVQTKQKELNLFKNYKKKYIKVDLDLDDAQQKIYDEVLENMEFGDEIDCENKLVQLVRLQQICTDPSGLVASYEAISPKFKWIMKFAKTNPNLKFIVMSKKRKPLERLLKLMQLNNISANILHGGLNLTKRNDVIAEYKTTAVQAILIQLDAGKESLTLPEAQCTIFLDRDFAQGYNEQAEARMTPIDGSVCEKLIIDLVMKKTKEEEIYNTLVVRKESIKDINVIMRKGA